MRIIISSRVPICITTASDTLVDKNYHQKPKDAVDDPICIITASDTSVDTWLNMCLAMIINIYMRGRYQTWQDYL